MKSLKKKETASALMELERKKKVMKEGEGTDKKGAQGENEEGIDERKNQLKFRKKKECGIKSKFGLEERAMQSEKGQMGGDRNATEGKRTLVEREFSC